MVNSTMTLEPGENTSEFKLAVLFAKLGAGLFGLIVIGLFGLLAFDKIDVGGFVTILGILGTAGASAGAALAGLWMKYRTSLKVAVATKAADVAIADATGTKPPEVDRITAT